MPEVSTKVDLCQGHDACPPRAFLTFSPSLTVEGFEVVRESDRLHVHGCSQHPPHSAVVRRGWPTVYVNAHRVAYVGAPITCDSEVVATGRSSVLIGEGARIVF